LEPSFSIRTDVHAEANSRFSKFCEHAKQREACILEACFCSEALSVDVLWKFSEVNLAHLSDRRHFTDVLFPDK